MTAAFETPAGGWNTLAEMYEHYLSRTPSEEFISAAELIHAAEPQRRGLLALITSHDESGNAQERSKYAQELKELDDKVARTKSIAAQIMIRDAVDGIWYAMARRDGSGEHERIDPSLWRILLIDVTNGTAGRGPSLRYEDLRCRFDKVLASSIAETRDANPDGALQIALPVAAPSARVAVRSDRNGAPGRPSWMHLVRQEMNRRHEAGLLKPTLMAEADELKQWFSRAHPSIKPLTSKAIANSLRRVYWVMMRPKLSIT